MVYLAAILHHHVELGYSDLLVDRPLLAYLCKGIKRHHGTHTRVRLPLTSALLASLRPQVLRNQSHHTLDRLATWAALTLGFHGFLRGSEFTATTTSTFSRSHDMLLRDIAVESGHLTIVINASKIDPFRVTSTLPVAATHTSTCPVRAMKAFLRMARHGPLMSPQANTSPKITQHE